MAINNRVVLMVTTLIVACASAATLSVLKPRVPDEPVREFPVAGHAVLGQPGKGAEVVLFIDYNCPACKDFEVTHLPPLQRALIDTGKMHLYVFQSPFLAASSDAMATAAECALEQNQAAFWRYHHLLMTRDAVEGADVGSSELLDLASAAKLDRADFRSCLTNPASSAYTRVKRDLQTHEAVNMLGTPTVFVNGIRTPAGSQEINEAVLNPPKPSTPADTSSTDTSTLPAPSLASKTTGVTP